MNLELDKPLVFFDLETTGINITTDRIVEIFALKYYQDGKTEEFYSRYNPGIPIPADASAVHGIYDSDVAFEPYLKDVATHIVNFFEGCDIGGYNIIRFDVPLLAEELIRAGVQNPLNNVKFIDPMVIFHKKVSRSLSGALKYYRNEDLKDAHTAKADVLASIKVLESQLKVHEDLPKNSAALHQYVMNGREIIDFGGFFTKNNSGEVVFNFGKNKGKSLKSEPNYLKWMIKNDFPEHTKIIAKNYLSDQQE